jgi:hypothetical protein
LKPLPADGPADPWFRPVWEDGDDDSPPLPRRPPVRPALHAPAAEGLLGVDLPSLLGPLAAAQDALARLDAMAAAAPSPVRDGLIARLAFREAAGWLATLGCWVHPRDLALRAAHLIGAPSCPTPPGITGRIWIEPPGCWPRGTSRPRSPSPGSSATSRATLDSSPMRTLPWSRSRRSLAPPIRPGSRPGGPVGPAKPPALCC